MATLRLLVLSRVASQALIRITARQGIRMERRTFSCIKTQENVSRRNFSTAIQRRQELAVEPPQKVSTSGPLYSHVPEPTEYHKQLTIPVDGVSFTFPSIFLRDSCVCPQCVDVSTSQKNFQTCDIPLDIAGSFHGTTTTGGVEAAVIAWNSDVVNYDAATHLSMVPVDLLRRSAAGDDRRYIAHFRPSYRTFWDGATMTADNAFIDYTDYANKDSTLHKTLRKLESHGLVFLRDVPDCSATNSSSSISSIVDRIGPIRSTFYGSTWDVRSMPNAINVAYTHQFLGLHMDLCYVDYTPQFQLLHSLRARAPGGESIFSDSFLAAESLRTSDPELFRALVEFPVTFHYYNAGQSYRQVRNTVELADQSDLSSAIRNVNWSPPFQGPFSLDIGHHSNEASVRRFVEAAKKFDALVSAPENLFELRMNEGECVLFDNRRVLHARRAFDPSVGERWLKGAYVDRDVFASKLARLEERFW